MLDGEDLCRRCGRCCFEKLIVGDEVILTETPCPHLTRERRCAVYPDRHAQNTRCLPLAEAIAARAFPADCPYVRDLPDYRPPLDPRAGPEAAARVREILQDVAPDESPR